MVDLRRTERAAGYAWLGAPRVLVCRGIGRQVMTSRVSRSGEGVDEVTQIDTQSTDLI